MNACISSRMIPTGRIQLGCRYFMNGKVGRVCVASHARVTAHSRTGLLWRELSQVVDSKLLFESTHLIDDFEETLVAKQLILFLLKILAEGVVFVRGDDGAKRRKQDRIFAGLMRTIHAQE